MSAYCSPLSQRRDTTSSDCSAAMVGSPPPNVRLPTRRNIHVRRLSETRDMHATLSSGHRVQYHIGHLQCLIILYIFQEAQSSTNETSLTGDSLYIGSLLKRFKNRLLTRAAQYQAVEPCKGSYRTFLRD